MAESLKTDPTTQTLSSGLRAAPSRDTGSSCDWYLPLKEKLDRLVELSAGWDSYEAPPPSQAARSWAKEALELLATGCGCPPQRLAPSVEGGVAISWRSGRRNANVEFFNTGEIYAATSDGTGHPEIWEVAADTNDLTRALDRILELEAEPSRANAASGATD